MAVQSRPTTAAIEPPEACQAAPQQGLPYPNVPGRASNKYARSRGTASVFVWSLNALTGTLFFKTSQHQHAPVHRGR
jgi:hypothetical protein